MAAKKAAKKRKRRSKGEMLSDLRTEMVNAPDLATKQKLLTKWQKMRGPFVAQTHSQKMEAKHQSGMTKKQQAKRQTELKSEGGDAE